MNIITRHEFGALQTSPRVSAEELQRVKDQIYESWGAERLPVGSPLVRAPH